MRGHDTASYFVHNIGELWTPEGKAAAAGAAMQSIKKVRGACLYVKDGRIAWVGEEALLRSSDSAVAWEALDAPAYDAEGRSSIPGFVDSHTHFIFAGWREEEFFWRARGVPYMDIHRRGGGIQNSVLATRAATLEDLILRGRKRLEAMLSMGTTTVEGKSGYGLDLDTEMRQLHAMRELAKTGAPDIVPTFMGAHSIPPEFNGRPRAYLSFLAEDVLPRVKRERLAHFVDIFCEEGVFDIEDSRWYLERARAAGFALKIHADEVAPLGGTALAAELGAVSADHLLKASDDHIAALAASGAVACLLPLTAFNLREPYPLGRRFIDAGCPVALASDFNPGSCPSHSIPLIFALAVLYMGMSVEETLTALTLNGAAALKLAGRTGSIEVGKDADFLLLDAPSPAHLAYQAGMNLVHTVFKRGVPVWRNGTTLGERSGRP